MEDNFSYKCHLGKYEFLSSCYKYSLSAANTHAIASAAREAITTVFDKGKSP